jgi:plasmid maintenance system antidote protein VapI
MQPTLTDTLRQAILNAGVSRYAIAQQTGVSEAALSRFVSGERGLTLESVDRLLPVLGLEVKATKRRGK